MTEEELDKLEQQCTSPHFLVERRLIAEVRRLRKERAFLEQRLTAEEDLLARAVEANERLRAELREAQDCVAWSNGEIVSLRQECSRLRQEVERDEALAEVRRLRQLIEWARAELSDVQNTPARIIAEIDQALE